MRQSTWHLHEAEGGDELKQPNTTVTVIERAIKVKSTALKTSLAATWELLGIFPISDNMIERQKDRSPSWHHKCHHHNGLYFKGIALSGLCRIALYNTIFWRSFETSKCVDDNKYRVECREVSSSFTGNHGCVFREVSSTRGTLGRQT